MHKHFPLPALFVALLFGLSACDQTALDSAGGDLVAGNAAAGPNADLFKSVRRATTRYNSTNQAIRAGYVPDDHCAAHPDLGGMGYHWINPDIIDPVFDPLQPEVMLYETGPGGNLRLVAVEYIVIAATDFEDEALEEYLAGDARPHFGDQPFDIRGVPPLMAEGVPHWSLHVWVHKNNPSGPFAPFNPDVSCG